MKWHAVTEPVLMVDLGFIHGLDYRHVWEGLRGMSCVSKARSRNSVTIPTPAQSRAGKMRRNEGQEVVPEFFSGGRRPYTPQGVIEALADHRLVVDTLAGKASRGVRTCTGVSGQERAERTWRWRTSAGAPPSTGCGCRRASRLRRRGGTGLPPNGARARCTHDCSPHL